MRKRKLTALVRRRRRLLRNICIDGKQVRRVVLGKGKEEIEEVLAFSFHGVLSGHKRWLAGCMSDYKWLVVLSRMHSIMDLLFSV